jgi:8-oxo-dGTP pyrophosphatase MutT (NUDIX family)
VPPILLRLIHPLARTGHRLLSLVWFVTRPKTVGAHAIPLDAQGRVILVRLSYASGWRLPGGGVKPDEDRAEAILRELREEIGLVAHSRLTPVGDFEHRPNFCADHATLFLVEGVEHRFRPSLEVADARPFPLDALPDDLPPITLRLLAMWRE